MDFREKKRISNPRESASSLSRLFFLWTIPLFRKGSKKDLGVDDMYDVPSEDVSQSLGLDLQAEWDHQCRSSMAKARKPNFFYALSKLYGGYYIALGLGLFFDECVIRVALTIFLRLLIRSFADKTVSQRDQYIYALGVCLTSFVHAVIIHPIFFEILHIGMKCRVATSSLIYRKTLRLSKAAQDKTTVGQLINLLSTDVDRFDRSIFFIPYLLIGPLQTAIFACFLWEELGISCIAGIGLVVLLMPIQYYMGIVSKTLRFKIAKKTDERGRIMNEIIMAIRVIKMYAWENPFSSLINEVRREEVKVLRKRAYLRAFYLSLFLSSKKFIPYLTFLVYVLCGHTLTADKVFFAVPIFDVVIENMLSTLPSAAGGVGEMMVSIKRVHSFLLLEEKPLGKISDNILYQDSKSDKMPQIQMHNVSATWTNEKPHLHNVSLDLKGEKLIMIVGPVGCGKSTLLQVILKELKPSCGHCYTQGDITYASQDPWIFSGTLRQNILFGKGYDKDLYDSVVSACALSSDFEKFPQGDLSFVGDRGITLSGGQKARVNLARALYREGTIYLLDDPLSAVDSRVGRHIFEKGIKKYLAGHLRILVTHQLQYLPKADHIIVMQKGNIVAQGTYEEIMEKELDFVGLMMADVESDLYRRASLSKLELMEQELKQDEETRKSQVEKMSVGSVAWSTYWEYFKAGGSLCAMIMVLLGFVLSQVLYTTTDYWLSYWTNAEEAWSTSLSGDADNIQRLYRWNYTVQDAQESFYPQILELNETAEALLSESTSESPSIELSLEDIRETIQSYLGQNFYIYVYSILVVLVTVATNLNSSFFYKYCMKISINIHNRMFKNLARAPVKFFDENPSGRIMNRFTKDLCSLDEFLPSSCFDVITILLIMLGVIFVVMISNYAVIIPSVCLVISLWLIRKYYVQTARDVKRVEAICRSPIFTHLTASMQGLNTIRALQAEKLLIDQFNGLQDTHSASWFLFLASNRSFAVWLEMISVVFLSIVTFSFLLLSQPTKGGFVGLAISSILSVTFKFQWGMRQSAELENLMTSVERCLEYMKIKSEAPLTSTEDRKPPKSWPDRGNIKFRNVSLRYDEKLVLSNLTFDIAAKQKVGIVGRTGAGKSSIIAALFRMTEPEGEILIDDVDISKVGLHDLRQVISIIPQDPVLFSGSLRYNLDPFNQFNDHELWKVIEEVDLKEVVTALDLRVNDGGTNFSVGQRQLVCLARAILRNNKIIVMDEATANVDFRTDQFVQDTIRRRFSECTIIIIAHRLNSVMDCNKIMVLDNGDLKEYNHPHILLQKNDSLLSIMAKHTGKTSHNHLKKQAANAYYNQVQSQEHSEAVKPDD